MTRGRIAGAVVVAAILLTGCQIKGTVDIERSEAAIDLTLTHQTSRTSNPCNDIDAPFLSKQVSVPREGWLSCRFTGRMPLSALLETGAHLTASDDSIVLTSMPSLRRDPAAGAGRPRDDIPADADLDLTLTFPGDVVLVTADGTISGRQVHFSDFAAAYAEGIGVVARPSTSTDITVWLWGLLALLAGTIVSAGAIWTRRRWLAGHPHLAAAPTPAEPAPTPRADPKPAEPPLELPPEEPSVWAVPDDAPGEDGR